MLDPPMILRAPGFAKGTHCVDARPFLHIHPLVRVRTVGFLLVVAFMVTVSAASFSAEQKQPNVLLVLSDDHSVPHVGCYGDGNTRRFGITPNLDSFAKEGMRFDRAYTSAPQCAPSRISIFAARSPVSLGVTRFAQPPRGQWSRTPMSPEFLLEPHR